MGEKFFSNIEQNIPDGTIALKEGAKVLTAECKIVGRMECIMVDMPADADLTTIL